MKTRLKWKCEWCLPWQNSALCN